MTIGSWRWMTLWTAVVTSPLLVLSAFLWLSSVNPMAETLALTFSVANHTGMPLRMTPMGFAHHSGKLVTLSQYQARGPLLPALVQTRLLVPAGAAVRVRYDADDVTLSELVVEDGTSPPRRFVVGEDVARNGVAIRDVSALPLASAALVSQIERPVELGLWLAHMGGIVPMALFGVFHLLGTHRDCASARGSS